MPRALPVNTNVRGRSNEFVATTRDRWGRMLAPIQFNGQGPFHLVVNTGANASVVTERVARTLGSALEAQPSVLVHGVIGSAPVRSIRLNSVSLGRTEMSVTSVPVIADATDCADGFLALLGFTNKRVLIDFQQNKLALLGSARFNGSSRRAENLRLDLSHRQLPIINTRVHRVTVKAVIDTGSISSVGNAAMRNILNRAGVSTRSATAGTVGTESVSVPGSDAPLNVPLLELGSLRILGMRISSIDVPLFGHVNLLEDPAMLLGMDVLGQFEQIILDYGGKTAQFLPRMNVAAGR
jgi:hypothetical protein